MIENRMTIKIAGEAGQGVESSGAGFARAFSRGGLRICAVQDYMSRIRGGHNYYIVRVSDEPLYTFTDEVHLLLPFTKEGVDQHKGELVPGGAVLYDQGLGIDAASLEAGGVQAFPVPLIKIATEVGGNRIMMNTAAIGAAAGVTEYDFARIEDVIRQNFQKKGGAVVESNITVARTAYDLARREYARKFQWKLVVRPRPARMVIHGNHAFCLGAVAAGCKFISAYPMTPASSIIEWMSGQANTIGMVTKQTEDELAAILMAIGASHAGVRAMTATSGGGFSLMVEALGLAACSETPLVVVEAQRAGPSTGLPTKTEQSDLEFVIHASQGEFPRIVLAPGTQEQCFDMGYRAFNLAEKYQCPVILLTDLYLSAFLRDIDPSAFPIERVPVDRGLLLTDQELAALSNGPYKRHEVTSSGISPRAIPSHPRGVYVTAGDEHTEFGFLTEDPAVRNAQMEKRMRKLETALREDIQPPRLYGPAQAEVTFLGWGSTYGSIREAVDTLNANGTTANFLQFIDLWPFPAEVVTALLDRARYLVGVEQNFTGQLCQLIRACTGKTVDQKILRYDGYPISPGYILGALKKEVQACV